MGDHIYFVEEGRCRATKKSATSGVADVVIEIAAGSYFGASRVASLSIRPRHASVYLYLLAPSHSFLCV